MDLSNLKIDLSAISAAAEKLKKERTAETKFEAKRTTTKRTSKTTSKSAPKTNTTKVENGAQYMIGAGFKQAIEGYLLGRGDMLDKMAHKDKSIDKCCEFIYSSVLKKTRKMANGKHYVAVCPPDSDVFGLAVHYYDESNEALEKELKGE